MLIVTHRRAGSRRRTGAQPYPRPSMFTACISDGRMARTKSSSGQSDSIAVIVTGLAAAFLHLARLWRGP